MIYLGLGSNIGERKSYLQQAVTLLTHHSDITLVQTSAIYETPPFGYTDQPAFLNVVISIESALSPSELLVECLRVESILGRVRDIRWGPRTIDIDILLYHDLKIQTESLKIPHPYLHLRPFVLVPLSDLTRESEVYQGKTASELLAACEPTTITVYGKFGLNT